MRINAKGHFRRPLVFLSAFWLFLCFLNMLAGISFAESHSVIYQYDAASRLTGVTYSNGTSIQYTYDAAGNMLTKKVSLMSECPECAASPVNLTNVTFGPGRTCACSDNTSITLGTGVTVESGANITFKAPKINLKPGFKAKPGSVVKMQQQ